MSFLKNFLWGSTTMMMFLSIDNGKGRSFAFMLLLPLIRPLQTLGYLHPAVSFISLSGFPAIFQNANKNKVDLLILDNFGLIKLDINKFRNLFEIFEAREGRRSTIVISQLPVDQWYDLFVESTYAEACLDKLLVKAYRLTFQSASMHK